MKRLAIFVFCVFLLVGCGSYYKVIDPSSKNAYYTENVEQMSSGAIKFKDTRTNSDVILQSSEVKEISSEEFHKATKPEKK